MSDFNFTLLRTANRIQTVTTNLVKSPYIPHFVKTSLQTPLAFLHPEIVTFRNALESAASSQKQTANSELSTVKGEIDTGKSNIMNKCLNTLRVLESHRKHILEAKARIEWNSKREFMIDIGKSFSFLGFGGVGHFIYGVEFKEPSPWTWLSILSLVAGVVYFVKGLAQLLPSDVKNKMLLSETVEELENVSTEINTLSYDLHRGNKKVDE